MTLTRTQHLRGQGASFHTRDSELRGTFPASAIQLLDPPHPYERNLNGTSSRRVSRDSVREASSHAQVAEQNPRASAALSGIRARHLWEGESRTEGVFARPKLFCSMTPLPFELYRLFLEASTASFSRACRTIPATETSLDEIANQQREGERESDTGQLSGD